MLGTSQADRIACLQNKTLSRLKDVMAKRLQSEDLTFLRLLIDKSINMVKLWQ